MIEKPFIDYLDIPEDFKRYLELPGNDNILFSGKFGSGKSTFIDDFFKKNEEDYLSIHLYPVHYAVSSNEDVFELIKVDIIQQLFAKGVLKTDKLKAENSSLKALKSFAQKHPLKLTALIAGSISKLNPFGEMLAGTTGSVYELMDAVAKYQKEYNEEIQGDAERAENHTVDFFNQKGTYLEFDNISYLIRYSLEQVKRTKVLVIDDLDRLDPEHTFRIMNVFAAHSDVKLGINKFGFDKVLLIAHFENLKNIFHHKYGKDTDFRGYIGKFYNAEIFEFDFQKILNVKIKEYAINFFKTENEINVFAALFRRFMDRGVLQIRELEKIVKLTNKVFDDKILQAPIDRIGTFTPIYIEHNTQELYLTLNDIPLVKMFVIFIRMFGRKADFESNFKSALDDRTFRSNQELESLINLFVLPYRIYLVHNSQSKRKKDNTMVYHNKITVTNSYFDSKSPDILISHHNIDSKVVPKWGKSRKFNGDCSYFEHAEVVSGYTNNFDVHSFWESLRLVYDFFIMNPKLIRQSLVSK